MKKKEARVFYDAPINTAKTIMFLGITLLCYQTKAYPAHEVALAADGKALQPVVISENATARVKTAASELAKYLGLISSASFALNQGDGACGIVVGISEDFPGLPDLPKFNPDDVTDLETYILRSHQNGLYLIGATESAVEHGVWDLLFRLGYRQFFPGRTWEVIPRTKDLKIQIDTLQRPSFFNRRLGSATSSGPEAYGDREAYNNWMKRNRLAISWPVKASHAYQAIHARLKTEFEAHPEYLGLINGERQSTKFCISNPNLRALIIEYALDYFKQHPTEQSISMEPSDGGDWCECEECAAMGSISTRVVFLANAVAEAINKAYTNKYVGILAYNFHCAPPEIKLHPNVMVSIATGQLTGNWNAEDMLQGWAAQGAGGDAKGMGVGEYYSIIIGNKYLPGRAASNIAYVKRSIPKFYKLGARRFGGDASYGNGAVALTMYMASRIIWDISEADRTDELYQDFLEKAFGRAAKPMDVFFRHIYLLNDDDKPTPVTVDKVGRMYRALEEAMPLADNPAVKKRIQDMILYTRYMELSLADDFGDVLRFAWRTRDRMLVNTYGLFVYPPTWKSAQLWQMPAKDNPYKEAPPLPETPDIPESAAAALAKSKIDSLLDADDELKELFADEPKSKEKNLQKMPFSDEEIASILKQGVANNRVGTFKTKDFSDDLVPTTPLGFADEPLGNYNFGLSVGGRRIFYTWVEQAPTEIKLRIAGGFIWPDRSDNVEVYLFSDKAPEADNFLVATDKTIPPDQKEHTLALKTPYDGLHRIEIEGGNGATTVEPDTKGMAFTVKAGPEKFFRARFVWEGWFYIPKGTKELSFYVAHPSGEILDREGLPEFSFKRSFKHRDGRKVEPMTDAGYYTIPVPPEKDGTLWKLSGVRGIWLLLNVPPSVARRPSELLLPREVVEADK